MYMYQMIKPKEPLYILFDSDSVSELNLYFTRTELLRFRRMWGKGESVEGIARRLNRDQDEVALLIIDQARQGEIQKR